MISPEQTLATARLGFVEYLASTPWRIHLLAEWPLAIAQCLFYTLLGRIVAGEPGGQFAFIGALAMVLTLSTVGGVGSLPGTEKWGGTFFRLQLSGLPPASVFGLRSLPYVANGLFSVVLCLLLVGPITGNLTLAIELLPMLPVYVVLALTSAAAGLAAASPAMGRRTEVVITNGLMYLMVAACGLFIPAGKAPVLDAVGTVLPLRHGVLAIRAYVDGQPWLGHLGWEVVVGLAWAVVAYLLFWQQAARARRSGTDDFA